MNSNLSLNILLFLTNFKDTRVCMYICIIYKYSYTHAKNLGDTYSFNRSNLGFKSEFKLLIFEPNSSTRSYRRLK